MASTVKHRSAGKKSDRRGAAQPSRQEDAGKPPAVWSPSPGAAFKALLAARLCAALWSHITDCDETFNYWEPLSYLSRGRGYQTWEYSPVYAIRSYTYVWLYMLPLRLYTAVAQNAVGEFYILRIVLALVSALCETFFYRAVRRQFGAGVGRLMLCFQLFGAGMYISSTAFLPSSFSMYLTCVAFGAWYTSMYPLAIFSIAVSAIVGWPFTGVLGIPIAWDIVVRQKRLGLFIGWSVLSAIVCLAPLVAVDSHYYGKLVVTPLNIVLYNVFSTHGPDIYGVEPWTFYFVNGFLNFNFVFLLALVSVPLVIIFKFFLTSHSKGLPVWLSLGAMYLWMLIIFTRPHKEERFLFPIYPLICLAGAVSLDQIMKVVSALQGRRGSAGWLAVAFCLGTSSLSVSRMLALYRSYHGPLQVYGELHQILQGGEKIHDLPLDTPVNVCVGKEWYRFPTSMFLPGPNWKLQFVKSQFRGQLPKLYSTEANATRLIPSHMNDMNREEPSRYVPVSKCHYFVDLDLPEENPYEPRYSQNTKDWKLLYSAKFLDSRRSHSVFRAFFVPFMSDKHCSFADYNVLQSRHYKEIIL